MYLRLRTFSAWRPTFRHPYRVVDTLGYERMSDTTSEGSSTIGIREQLFDMVHDSPVVVHSRCQGLRWSVYTPIWTHSHRHQCGPRGVDACWYKALDERCKAFSGRGGRGFVMGHFSFVPVGEGRLAGNGDTWHSSDHSWHFNPTYSNHLELAHQCFTFWRWSRELHDASTCSRIDHIYTSLH